MARLESIEVSGFKSVGTAQRLALGDVTVCLGANGAGKSNLVSFFRMLNFMTTGGLQNFVARSGMANAVLHFGSAMTKTVSFQVNFSNEGWRDCYKADLAFGMPDALFFTGEQVVAHREGADKPFSSFLQSAGLRESGIHDAGQGDAASAKTCRVVSSLLAGCRAFQFHDTSETAHIRNSCYIESSNYLMSDAGNLPAFLYAMQKNKPKHYQRIVNHIQFMVPQFQDFRLQPSAGNPRNIFLNWVGERGDEYLFGPHQLSDGSLRYMALTTLLLQPKEMLPAVIVLDEPELGLHPAAIVSLAEMISVAKQNCQIVLATQSPKLANQFSAENVVIVDYNKQKSETELKRLDVKSLEGWLKDYSIAELWEKNVLGGRP